MPSIASIQISIGVKLAQLALIQIGITNKAGYYINWQGHRANCYINWCKTSSTGYRINQCKTNNTGSYTDQHKA